MPTPRWEWGMRNPERSKEKLGGWGAGRLKAESSEVKVEGVETEKLRRLEDEKIRRRHTRTHADIK